MKDSFQWSYRSKEVLAPRLHCFHWCTFIICIYTWRPGRGAAINLHTFLLVGLYQVAVIYDVGGVGRREKIGRIGSEALCLSRVSLSGWHLRMYELLGHLEAITRGQLLWVLGRWVGRLWRGWRKGGPGGIWRRRGLMDSGPRWQRLSWRCMETFQTGCLKNISCSLFGLLTNWTILDNKH